MLIHTPVELMTAAERAGWRMACEAMRLNGARIERSGQQIGDADASAVPKGQLLSHCGKMVQVVADLTDAQLDYAKPARPVSLAQPDDPNVIDG
ncbi:hypothetical protein [Paenirhodobacter sp. CAU 1674]|uniref:hypothetical protein n=1 Tax=Paenirhodobacter sp. CAU 1674 TaxID=3032596 RepID=UPI0023DBC6F8|nr:hypothetical protein [Paenirhodobacter sp. CAU 1674]MDF2143232.1 hypothetical protein [Paenirhodobacter sp. CAU 1674]